MRKKTIAALKWSFAGTVGTQAIQFIISIVLARLLVPSEFGLIAMLSLFLALAASMLDSGFGSALIQKQSISRQDESSVFYFNIAVSLLMFGSLWAAAPPIARFFGEPALTPLCRFLGLNLVINSFGLVQGVLLIKRLDFKTQSQVAMAACVISGLLGVTMAWQGCGVWSLAAQALAYNVVRVLLYWLLNPWRPAAVFSLASLKSMFPFGSRLLFSGLLNTVFENSYQLVIGKLYSKNDLGFYTRGLSTQRLPVSLITTILSQVAFPAFSSIQDDRPRLKSAYRKTIVFAGFLTFPVMLGLLAVARPLFLLLFGAKWAPSIGYFEILCLAGMLLPLHALNLNVLMAIGRSDIFFRLEIIKKVVVGVALLSTLRLGIQAMVWGQVASSILCLAVNTYYSGILIAYPLREQLRDVLPGFLLSGVMAAAVYGLSIGVGGSLMFKIPLLILAGALIYITGSAAMRLAPFFELKALAGGRLAYLKQWLLGES